MSDHKNRKRLEAISFYTYLYLAWTALFSASSLLLIFLVIAYNVWSAIICFAFAMLCWFQIRRIRGIISYMRKNL